MKDINRKFFFAKLLFVCLIKKLIESNIMNLLCYWHNNYLFYLIYYLHQQQQK